ncbi:putative gustatory receptor 28b, partial [Atheta coriaria]|uniref:putative gustatory receptor 28b n=1 Tax=Dalotia coriaria TaxID=877792 RepID=UPI0031F3478A
VLVSIMSDITEILQPLLILGKYTLLFYKTSSESLTLLSISKEINRDVILVKLRWLRPLHMRVTELIQMFNDIFGVNLLAMNAMFFAQFVLLGSTLIDYFGKTVFPIGFIVIKLAYLVLFSGYVWIICHYKKTGEIVHSLEDVINNENNKKINSELMTFSLQISNLRKEFTAADFFIVNYTLLFKIVGALVTYLIILMQFRS